MRQFIIILLVVALALLLPYSLKAQDRLNLGTPSRFTHLLSPRVGDLLTVLFVDDTSAENETQDFGQVTSTLNSPDPPTARVPRAKVTFTLIRCAP